MNNFSHVILKSGEEGEIIQGFPWAYDNEIQSVKWNSKDGSGVKTTSLTDAEIADGDVVEVYSSKGAFLGSAVINKKSRIAVRFIGSEHADKIMEDRASYWEKVVAHAVNVRALNFSPYDSCRLIYGESDFIPGLVVEKYVASGSVYLVVQFLSLACEVFRDEIINALKNIVKPDGIYERSDAAIREKEGLEQRSGWIYGSGDDVVEITENEIKLQVDIARGQKTGYFLDQKFNRKEIQKYCHGKRVLDTFTHTGAFGLNAVKGGAREVVSVDISEDAVKLVEHNIQLNNAQNVMKAECADVFDLLKKYESEGQKFDVIILDPPAFTKSAKMIQKAYGGYKEINLRAMRLLNPSGILVSCSCSAYFDETTFYSMLSHAASDSHRKVQVLEKRCAGPDHPVLLGYPKSAYLKCAICRVM
ncbi:MAG: class I SAM-dependent rRNA methyltransferase [Treponema sp.]|nr:class I SAM-dependent rRNA methyltransferase [Treponema sp.]